ncbi:hypothetical protein BOX15_Mlig018005g1 [Macrostomum lignano]|uniref:Secreted protein n=1 Tax=Macrostomum lignano TaxID=282301 RepID=A0A267F3Y9_9PLAT|nr:hypothetical protein BOX15_Mlig018005g2 [Macrostomum lignano]PAA67799.1 hypothetical protein BOX15_Mlig018005g1 [Macrostomum lignano]
MATIMAKSNAIDSKFLLLASAIVLCCGAIPNQGPSEDSYSNYVEESVDFQAPAKRGPENMLMRKFICDYYRHHNWKPPAYLKCHQM